MSCHAAQQLDLLGYGHTWVHRLDSRAKLIAVAGYIVCVASFQKYTVAALVPFLIAPVAAGIAGRVAWRPVFRLLFAAAPFALLVGWFNPWLDRHPPMVLGPWLIPAGWFSFLSIILRFVLTTGMVLMLVSTTSMPGLLHGLIRLRVPRPFVTQLQFLYRYLFLLVDESSHVIRARQVRDPAHRHPSMRTARKMLASLLMRTWDRAERVYRCMKARGFKGDFPAVHADHWHMKDILFITLFLSVCFAARFLPVTEWLGVLIMKGVS